VGKSGEQLWTLRALYRGRPGRVEFVDVPPLPYVALGGAGDPERPAFARAVGVVTAVDAAARQLLKRRSGQVAPPMPLETLWWVEHSARVDLVAALALDLADHDLAGRRAWRWKALIALPGLDAATFDQAVQLARRAGVPAIDEVRFERWQEGRVAQALHVGPCTQQGSVLHAMHCAIEEAGYRPSGRRHEIHLNDLRRTPAANLRTLLRQPVEAA
jgi:hypothetical protein